MPMLAHSLRFEGTHGSTRWEGRVVGDDNAFRTFLRGPVHSRVGDTEGAATFEAELQGLATTGMATEFLAKLLRSVPDSRDWEIGEALAECVLEDGGDRQISWPWNTVRDRRTPRASLPGADLVEFCRQDDVVLLLFGEVKTSSDPRTPPNVMYGGSGMVWQLQTQATHLDVQHALLSWLRTRCTTSEQLSLYRSAVGRYLASQGKELLLVGILLRDTSPDERDVRSRAAALAQKLSSPTRVEIVAWYLPVPIPEWPALLHGEAP